MFALVESVVVRSVKKGTIAIIQVKLLSLCIFRPLRKKADPQGLKTKMSLELKAAAFARVLFGP